MTLPSYIEYPDGPGMTRARMEMIFENYDPLHQRQSDPLVTPLHAELKGLPHTIVAAAEIDVLRSESELLAKHLEAADVQVTAWIEPGVTHGFINRGRLLEGARNTLQTAATVLASVTNAD